MKQDINRRTGKDEPKKKASEESMHSKKMKTRTISTGTQESACADRYCRNGRYDRYGHTSDILPREMGADPIQNLLHTISSSTFPEEMTRSSENKQAISRNSKEEKPAKGQIIHDGARNLYEGKVIAESLKRGGKNPQLKGIIHEHLIKDSINYNPENIVKGIKADLTKNPNAKTVDIVVTRGKKVISRIQAKDTVGSLSKTIRQIKSGQYNSAKILGTKETVAKLSNKLAKEGIKKTAVSSGISSDYTQALAVKAGSGAGIGNACKSMAKSNALTGGVVSGGFALLQGVKDLANEEKDLGEVIKDVTRETVGGGISAAGAGVASTATGAGVATLVSAIGIVGVAATGLTLGLSLVAGILVGGGIKSFLDSIFD